MEDEMKQLTEKMTTEEALERALKKVQTAARLRMFFLLAALLMVLLVFYGNKFAMETVWYSECRNGIYHALFCVVALMLGTTLAKSFFAAAYHRLLKETENGAEAKEDGSA